MSRAAGLWAVTCLFNPAGYRSRVRNYRAFRAALDLPLVAVELAFGGRPFALAAGDADVLVRVRGGDVLWQKERLLNVGVGRLPAACDRVLVVDADVVCPDPGWGAKVAAALDEFPLVQAFRRVYYLAAGAAGPGGPVDGWQRSLAAAAADTGVAPIGPPAGSGPRPPGSDNPGMAWAARRDLLAAHGLYDAAVVGGGDTVFAHTAFGNAALVPDDQRMNPRQAAHYGAWAGPLARAIGRRVGVVDADLYHLWHDHLSDRRCQERLDGLAEFRFDPAADLALAAAGAWRWASDKPAMHAFVRAYFAARNEDGQPEGG